ncbi:hypothetical protein JCM5296_002274 [Sporobolomyces johnsonii]
MTAPEITTNMHLFHLNETTALANSTEYTDIHQAVSYVSKLLDEAGDPLSLLRGKPWLEGHYALTLALAYHRLRRRAEAEALIERAERMASMLERDPTGLKPRIAAARSECDAGGELVSAASPVSANAEVVEGGKDGAVG